MCETGRSISPRSQGELYVPIPDMPVFNSRMRRKVRLRRDYNYMRKLYKKPANRSQNIALDTSSFAHGYVQRY